MPAIAKLRYLNIAPRKVRLVVDLIRGKSVEQAQTILKFTVKKATRPLLSLLKSAVANAKNNFQLDSSNLYIAKIMVDEGPKLKRFMPRARGQAYEIQKKTSHITLVLDEIEKKKKKKIKKTQKAEILKEVEKIKKTEKPKFKPKEGFARPRAEKGINKFDSASAKIRRIFRRKSF
jgi:large subunit ribosomal protein L22